MDELAAVLSADLPSRNDAGALAEILYDRCYTRSILDATQPSGGDGDLTSDLIAANQGSPSWDEGWRIDQILDGGRILARKDGFARAFLPGEYLTHRGLGSGPVAGGPVSIFMPPSSSDLQPGYHFAFGETVDPCGEGQALVRFYWNISAEGGPRLIEEVTRQFNRFQIPFRLKCASRRSDYPRRDAAVLYLNRRWYPIAALLIDALLPSLQPWLSAGTPLFAKRLADGLGFAEDPGDSFGKHRCSILAESMCASQGWPVETRLFDLRAKFEQRGLSLDQPWLNPGSVDCYEFPFPA